ncbi:hypothetical protein Ancab_035435 [Ancistrocladus abbreviatus]
MCIVAFAWQAHPLCPLLLLLNRDEYHNRPTQPVGWWEDGEILGGRDDLGGGTWLACSRGGRVAFLTNVLELHTLPEAKSRGELPVGFLKTGKSPKEHAEVLVKEAHLYNGFNLILADVPSKSMVYFTNRPKGGPIKIEDVSTGLHVLSNAKLDTPWPKAERLGYKFKKFLYGCGEGEVPIKDIVGNLMRDRVKADESRLPNICSLEWEYNLSSIFVEVETPLGLYGTRSTAALTVSKEGEVSFYETYLEKDAWKEQTLKYYIQKVKSVNSK